ncbi:MAG: efflux RND transporter periplasmic adaptor subunit [Phycisphaeraceae bacterium]|nr:efflux RND transporter periplasmic adaptor subunit [Phycisphaeraceae bacterium]
MFKRLSIFVAIIGIFFAIWVVATNNPKVEAPAPANPPSVNPFERGVVALGLVETATRDVQIAAPEPGRVVAIHTEVGRPVAKNDPLFTLDTTQLDADMLRAVAARNATKADLDRIKAQPRPEDIPPLRAAVDRARALHDDAADRLRNLELAAEVNAANPDEVARQRFAVLALRGSLATAQAELDRVLAGAWEPEVRIAEANLALREAEIEALTKRIDRLTVRSPIDGTVLKRDISEGEYFAAGASVAMVLGDLQHLRVRAQVDEEDTPLLRPGAKAIGRIRGPFDTRLELTMLWVEPLARPKRQISNAATELIDTRVVDVMFDIAPKPGVTLYPGQVLDVFIDAGPDNQP